MNGYIAVVIPRSDAGFDVRFPDLDGCACRAPSVADAYGSARRTLLRYRARLLARGRRLPPPRPSYEMAEEAARMRGVAAICLRLAPGRPR